MASLLGEVQEPTRPKATFALQSEWDEYHAFIAARTKNLVGDPWNRTADQIAAHNLQHRQWWAEQDRAVAQEHDERDGKAPLLSIPHFTLHDFRRTVSTLLHEMGYAPHVIEKSLGHVVKGVAGIYNKAAYIDERRTMLQQWGDYLEGLLREKVVPLRRSGKAA